MESTEKYIAMAIGATLAFTGVLLFAKSKTEGRNTIKLPGGIEFELSAPSLVIFISGLVVFCLPFMIGRQNSPGAYDLAGNEEEQVDRTAPKITVLSPGKNARIAPGLQLVTGRFDEGDLPAHLFVNGEEVSIWGSEEWECRVPITVYSKEIVIEAVDAAGHSTVRKLPIVPVTDSHVAQVKEMCDATPAVTYAMSDPKSYSNQQLQGTLNIKNSLKQGNRLVMETSCEFLGRQSAMSFVESTTCYCDIYLTPISSQLKGVDVKYTSNFEIGPEVISGRINQQQVSREAAHPMTTIFGLFRVAPLMVLCGIRNLNVRILKTDSLRVDDKEATLRISETAETVDLLGEPVECVVVELGLGGKRVDKFWVKNGLVVKAQMDQVDFVLTKK